MSTFRWRPKGRRTIGPGELDAEIRKLQKEMKEAAQNLEFERAAELRDQLRQLQSQELTLRDSPLDSDHLRAIEPSLNSVVFVFRHLSDVDR